MPRAAVRHPGGRRPRGGGAAIVFAAMALIAGPAQAADSLVMFEKEGCGWCERWHRDVGPVYPKTAEGKRLPLRRVDLGAPRPDDLRDIGGLVFSPTFVVMHCGREAGRVVGYGGEAHFYWMLGEIIDKLAAAADNGC